MGTQLEPQLRQPVKLGAHPRQEIPQDSREGSVRYRPGVGRSEEGEEEGQLWVSPWGDQGRS